MGPSELMFAAKYNNYKLAKLLLKHKADPNISCTAEKFALLYAVRNNNFKIVKLLLKNGADVN